MDGQAISFGPFRLFAEQRLLLEGDRTVRLGSRAFDILAALVERPGEVVGATSRRGSRLRAPKRSLHETQHRWMLPKKQALGGAEAQEALLDFCRVDLAVVRERHDAVSVEEMALAFRALPRRSQIPGVDEVLGLQ